MIRREHIRYGSFWVRLICCLAVAMGLVNAVYFNMLEAWEQVARSTFLDHPDAGGYVFAPRTMVFMVIFLVCIISAVFRIENPWAMSGYGMVLAVAYVLVVVEVAFIFEYVLPVASPLFGFLLASMFLGTISWSDERSSRKGLEQLERAKQQFADMLVHDLRGRISSIQMSLNLVDKKINKSDDRMQDLVNTMRLAAERALVQINDLLAIRKIEEGKMVLDRKTVPLAGLLRDSLEEHHLASEVIGVKIIFKDDESFSRPGSASLQAGSAKCMVNVDINVFARVIANLLWNALEHAPAGSQIEVGYFADENRKVTVYVANMGKIIPDEKKEILFNAFVSSRGESMMGQLPAVGLGLAFCKLAVEAHGGKVSIESPWEKTGDGVKVIIELPVSSKS